METRFPFEHPVVANISSTLVIGPTTEVGGVVGRSSAFVFRRVVVVIVGETIHETSADLLTCSTCCRILRSRIPETSDICGRRGTGVP